MEFVRLKYANNKLINADIKEHRDVIEEYVNKKGMEYIGFIPVLYSRTSKNEREKAGPCLFCPA